jgi:hypothetical protein
MKYVLAGVMQLQLSERYDLVIDKCTADAISCGPKDAILRVAQGVRKILAPDACWISLSYFSSRFDVDELPLTTDLFATILVPKQKETTPTYITGVTFFSRDR